MKGNKNNNNHNSYHKTFVSGYENDIIEYDFTEQSNQILDNYIAT